MGLSVEPGGGGGGAVPSCARLVGCSGLWAEGLGLLVRVLGLRVWGLVFGAGEGADSRSRVLEEFKGGRQGLRCEPKTYLSVGYLRIRSWASAFNPEPHRVQS